MDQYEGTGRTTNDQRSPSLPRRRRAARWLAGASLLLGFACSGPGDEFGDLGEADQDLLVSNYTTLWNGNQLGKGADISVCFAVAPQTFRNGDGSERVDCVNETNSSLDCLGQAIPGGTAAMRRHVRTYIENAWQRYADVHLNGWGDCAIDAATGTHKVENIQGVMIRFSHYVGDPVDWSGVGKSGSGATVIQYNAPALYHDGKYDDDLGNLVH